MLRQPQPQPRSRLLAQKWTSGPHRKACQKGEGGGGQALGTEVDKQATQEGLPGGGEEEGGGGREACTCEGGAYIHIDMLFGVSDLL